MRLSDLLSRLEPDRLEALCARRGVELDPGKRLPAPVQAARGLVRAPALGEMHRWPESMRRALERLAVRAEGLPREELRGEGLRLVRAGLAFVRPDGAGDETHLVLPAAYRLQVPPCADESPHAVRPLLAALEDDEVVHALVSSDPHAPRAGPTLLGLEPVLERLEREPGVDEVLRTLDAAERRLLEAMEARGGELETDELLGLEGQPLRYRGPELPKRSAAWSLVRRGLVLPRARGLWVVPEEVARVVGRSRRDAARAVRARILDEVRTIDRTPPRAELAVDPGAAAVALMAHLRAAEVTLRPGAGAPRSAVRRAARAAAVDPGAAEMLVSLARASALAERSAPLEEAGAVLFATWLRGAAWDEARDPADRFRAGEKVVAVPSPAAPLRIALIELLESLPERRFAEEESVVQAALADLRTSSVGRLLERARSRAAGAFERSPAEILQRMLGVSLPALGALDRSPRDRVVRFSARARAWLTRGAEAPAGLPTPGTWEGPGRLRVAGRTPVDRIVHAAQAADPFVAGDALYLHVLPSAVAKALDRGLPPEQVSDSLEALAPGLDPAARRALSEAGARVACELEPVSAFVRIPDEDLRESLLSDPRAAELLVHPSPSGGVLVRPGVRPERVRRALQRLGGALRIREGPPE